MAAPVNLCRLPWTGFSNDPDGKARPCCLFKEHITDENGKQMYVQTSSVQEIFQSKFMKDLRQQFRNNERPSPCSTCWIDEDNGYESKRQNYSTILSDEFNIDWENEPVAPSEYQMIINNSCNLKCRSCSPSHSTQWQAESRARTGFMGYLMPHDQAGDELGKLWTHREEWYNSLKRLEVVGGEPMYIKQWHKIFQELIDSGRAKDIFLNFSTNCTIYNVKLLNNICKHFKFVGIGLSVDGTGSVYEYLRHPGKWDEVYVNMKKYHEMHAKIENLNVQISYTISWLNALHLTTMHTLVDNEFPEFKIWNNIVHYPEHMAIWNIPTELKDAIAAKWDGYEWRPEYRDIIAGIKTFMYSKNEVSFTESLQTLYDTDKYRKESLLTSIPELIPYVR